MHAASALGSLCRRLRCVAGLALCAAAVGLAGCASAPPPSPAPLLDDAAFAPPTESVDPAQAFALSPRMQAFVQNELRPRLRAAGGRQRTLVEALSQRGRLRLDYDAAVTRSAAEAFDSGTGNCLSLVLMTAAIAKEVNLNVTFNRAVLEETWTRTGDYYFLNGHLNITLGRRLIDEQFRYDAEQYVMVDFLPPRELGGLRSVMVDERTVVAMFLNNRAAEALARGEVDRAYWWARAAVLHDARFMPAYNTLGVVYLQHRQPVQAERAFRLLLQREPSHGQALANLAVSLQRQGRGEESAAVARRLATLEDQPPFHWFNLGQQAMKDGRFRAARDLFARELSRDPDYHELHFRAGVAAWKLGDEAEARKHLDLALKNSITRDSRNVYAAKLDALNAHTVRR
jgi:Tfp pilus assembly protein PilF